MSMRLDQYLGKQIKVTFTDGQVLVGRANGYTYKLDTEEELYDELTMETSDIKYLGFNESEVKVIEIVN